MKSLLLLFVFSLSFVRGEECPCGEQFCLLGARMWWLHDDGRSQIQIQIQSSWFGDVTQLARFGVDIAEIQCSSVDSNDNLSIDVTVVESETINTPVGQVTRVKTSSETARASVRSGDRYTCIWTSPGVRYGPLENADVECPLFRLEIDVDVDAGSNNGPVPCLNDVEDNIFWNNGFVILFPCADWGFDTCLDDSNSPIFSEWLSPASASGVSEQARISGELPTIETLAGGEETRVKWDLNGEATASDAGDLYSLQFLTIETGGSFGGTMVTDFTALINDFESFCEVSPNVVEIEDGDMFEFTINVANLADDFRYFTDYTEVSHIDGPGVSGFPSGDWTPYEKDIVFSCSGYQGTTQDIVFEVCSSCGDCNFCGIVIHCLESESFSGDGGDNDGECHECSMKTCSQLNLDPNHEASSRVCASSDEGPLDSCSGRLTFDDAVEFCEDGDMRLCSRDELVLNEAANSGCGYDRQLIWSSTPCGGGDNYWRVAGEDDSPERECAPRDNETTSHVRCCADADFSNCCTEAPFEAITSPPSEIHTPGTSRPTEEPTERPTDEPLDIAACPEVPGCDTIFLECKVSEINTLVEAAEFIVCFGRFLRNSQLDTILVGDETLLEPQTDLLKQMLSQFIRQVDEASPHINSNELRMFEDNLLESRVLCFFEQVQCFMDTALTLQSRSKQITASSKLLERMLCDIVDIMPPGFRFPGGFKELIVSLVNVMAF